MKIHGAGTQAVCKSMALSEMAYVFHCLRNELSSRNQMFLAHLMEVAFHAFLEVMTESERFKVIEAIREECAQSIK